MRFPLNNPASWRMNSLKQLKSWWNEYIRPQRNYFIDFESFSVMANSKRHAEKKAEEMIASGNIPKIVNIISAD
jgi:hypothetical protein